MSDVRDTSMYTKSDMHITTQHELSEGLNEKPRHSRVGHDRLCFFGRKSGNRCLGTKAKPEPIHRSALYHYAECPNPLEIP